MSQARHAAVAVRPLPTPDGGRAPRGAGVPSSARRAEWSGKRSAGIRNSLPSGSRYGAPSTIVRCSSHAICLILAGTGAQRSIVGAGRIG